MFGSDSMLMPPVTLSDEATKDTDAARVTRYRSFLDFYNGAQWVEKRRPGERRLTVNYARTFIQKSASYLMGRPLKVEVVPNSETKKGEDEARRVERALVQMWDDNSLPLLDYDAAVDAAILGDAAFKVTLQPVKSGGSVPLRLAVDQPRNGPLAKRSRVVVRPCDVAGLQCCWRGDDMRLLLEVRESYRLTAGEARQMWPGCLDETHAAGERVPVVERWTEERMKVEVKGTVVVDTKNQYGFIPYVIIPNLSRPRQFWGQSDLEDLMTLNSELNVRVSVLSQLLQMSGNPVLVLENTEMAEGLRVGPGAVWTLPEGAKATLLEMIKEGGVELHVKYINLLYQMMHDLAELPGTGFGRDDASAASSGTALEILLHPVIQRVNRKRRIWDEALDLRNRMMLALAGLPVHRTRIVWPDVLPRDRSALVTQEVALVAGNIHSLETARRNLGDEQPEKELEIVLEEQQAIAVAAATAGAPAGRKGFEPPVRISGALVQGLSNSG